MKFLTLMVCLLWPLCPALRAAPVIQEFLAVNHGPGLDNFSEPSDWIAIHNPDGEAVNLEGYRLTDDALLPAKWVFPALSLAPGQTRIIRASGRDLRAPEGTLHTNFALKSQDGYVGLYAPSGAVVSGFAAYPKQFSGVSFGRGPGGNIGYFSEPGGEDGVTVEPLVDYVRDTSFSVRRGFFNAPFSVSLSVATAGAEIRYTLDGSVPSETSALYAGPLPVSTTTTLRARGFRAGWLPSNTDTQTYIFAGTWVAQSDAQPGLSPTWGQFNGSVKVAADYGMNVGITNSPVYGPQVFPALTTTLPVLCVTGNVADLFGDDGIQGNLRNGDAEVPVGVEYFNPRDAADRWSARASLNAHGGAVRNFPKKAFRLDFTGAHGDGPLNYPLFKGSDSENFDQLVLRAGGHDSFAARTRGGVPDQNDFAFHATYLRDQFLRMTEAEAGLLSPRGRYVHLCLNGLYWGLYDLHERPNAEFYESHAGGAVEDWDVVHHGPQLLDGTWDAWGELMNLASAGVATAEQYDRLAALTGPEGLIDHLLIRMWAADHDWLGPATMPAAGGGVTGNVAYYNSKNWYAARRSRGRLPGDWKFFTWDGEISMGSHLLFRWYDASSNVPAGLEFPHFRELRLDMTGIAESGTPAALWDSLRVWPAFQLKVADRARRLFGPGGVLSPEKAAARFESLREVLDLPMVAESARWGTVAGFSFAARNGVVVQTWDNAQLTRDTHWRPEVAWLRDTWAVARTPIFLDQLKARSLYPATPPAEVTPPGGVLAEGQSFVLTSPSGQIHYTVGGGDPRDGGPGVLVWPAGQGTVPAGSFTVRARVWNAAGNEWSALTEAAFSGAVDPVPGALVISEIHYHPAAPGAAELLDGFTDGDQFEFLEIMNVSTQRVNLSSLRFAAGVDFDFAVHSTLTELAPGGMLLLVADGAAFRKRYGSGLPVAGVFASGTGLSNGGERLKLITSSGV
ncbi:MAG: hypothetical protein JWL81_3129, partial [Verrucomicrobiales bacterium]|nr:hypothetical protein [Verrucomicrobiales bacterium]